MTLAQLCSLNRFISDVSERFSRNLLVLARPDKGSTGKKNQRQQQGAGADDETGQKHVAGHHPQQGCVTPWTSVDLLNVLWAHDDAPHGWSVPLAGRDTLGRHSALLQPCERNEDSVVQQLFHDATHTIDRGIITLEPKAAELATEVLGDL